MQQSEKPSIQRKGLEYKKKLLWDFIHSHCCIQCIFPPAVTYIFIQILSHYLGWQTFDIDIGRNSACKLYGNIEISRIL